MTIKQTIDAFDAACDKHGISLTQRESMLQESLDKNVTGRMLDMVLNGESPRMALMLAMQQPPGTKGTDSVFNAAENRRVGQQYSDEYMSKITAIAKRAGVDTTGKTYNGQLGKYHDPHAWVSGLGDVRAAAKAKGYRIEGAVNVDHLDENAPPKPAPKLSERLIREQTENVVAQNPGIAAKVAQSPRAAKTLREQIIDRHGSKRT